MPKRPVRLWLEALEDRWCPSLTVQNHHGDLLISGTPVGTNATGGLLIQGTAAHTNLFAVKDGSSSLGTFRVTGNVLLNLTDHQTEGINIDLNSNSIPRNLTIDLGAGNSSGDVQFSVAVYNSSGGATTGKIGGNLAVRGGSGSETFIPGFQNNFTITPPPQGLRVGGDLTFKAKVGGPTSSDFDVLDTGAGAAEAGVATPTVVVGGSVSTTAVDVVGLGPTTTVRKGVSIAAGERPLFVQDFATVHGSVSVTGSQLRAPNPVLGTAQLGDFIEVGGSPTGTAVVQGSLQLSSGAGDAFFLIDPGTEVRGRATISGGSGSDTVSAGGTFHRSLSVRLGNGNDSIGLAAGASVRDNVSLTAGNGNDSVTVDGTVGGNLKLRLGNGNDSVTVDGTVGRSLSVRLGNGNDSIGLAAGASVRDNVGLTAGNGNDSVTADGMVGGNLRFRLGNGNNTVTVGPAPGGRLLWASGNGNDSVTLGDGHTAAGSTWNVHMTFGTGNDTLTLADAAPATQFISGFVDLGGPPGGNVFNQGANWTIVPPFKLRNV
jgi:hypothetical protein